MLEISSAGLDIGRSLDEESGGKGGVGLDGDAEAAKDGEEFFLVLASCQTVDALVHGRKNIVL